MEKIIANQTGFVNILKPTGMTSSDVVCKVKKILQTKKVGHLGTLDPAASGVLPISIGKATKFFDYFLNKDKEYFAIVQFGVETDTLDSFGKVVSRKDKLIKISQIKAILGDFLGNISQIPPKYSAVKINGEKACDLARKDISFEIKPRIINIKNIEVIEELSENRFLFKVNCSAGTYIRTLFSDIAKKLNTVSTTPVIIRSKSGRFGLDSAITLEELENSKDVLSITKTFNDYSFFSVNDNVAKKLINGVNVLANELEDVPDGEEFFLENKDKLIGLYKVENNVLKRIVFLFEN